MRPWEGKASVVAVPPPVTSDKKNFKWKACQVTSGGREGGQKVCFLRLTTHLVPLQVCMAGGHVLPLGHLYVRTGNACNKLILQGGMYFVECVVDLFCTMHRMKKKKTLGFENVVHGGHRHIYMTHFYLQKQILSMANCQITTAILALNLTQVPCSSLQCSVQCSAVQCSAVQWNKVQCVV